MAEPGSEAQARRALAFADQRFLAGDVAGARRCARHALDLVPGLPPAELALVAYDVHAAAGNWYAVLGLPHPRPTQLFSGDLITHDAVKRQHRRLCLLVHPDKNPSAAADGAFKLVQAAYDALSAIHPPPPPRDEEQFGFWQAAAQDDVAPPAPATKQPPIARPPLRRAAPLPGPALQPIQLPCCRGNPPLRVLQIIYVRSALIFCFVFAALRGILGFMSKTAIFKWLG